MVEDSTIPWFYDDETGSCEQGTLMEQTNGQQQQQQQLEQQQQQQQQQQLQQQQGQEPNLPEFGFYCSPDMQQELGCLCGEDDGVACRDCNTCVCRG